MHKLRYARIRTRIQTPCRMISGMQPTIGKLHKRYSNLLLLNRDARAPAQPTTLPQPRSSSPRPFRCLPSLYLMVTFAYTASTKPLACL